MMTSFPISLHLSSPVDEPVAYSGGDCATAPPPSLTVNFWIIFVLFYKLRLVM